MLTISYPDGMDWVAAQHAEQDVKNIWARGWRVTPLSFCATPTQSGTRLFHLLNRGLGAENKSHPLNATAAQTITLLRELLVLAES